jgi:hypothetical protein
MQAQALGFRSWLAYALGFAFVLALVACIAIQALSSAPYSARSDDGYYLHYMRSVQEHGVGIFPQLFDAWNRDVLVTQSPLNKPSWVHPPPWRIGFIVFAAFWAKLFGASLVSLSWLSTISHLAWSFINWFFARRRMGDAFALALGTLCAFSPLLLGLARLALMDSFTVLWVTLSAWLFLEMLAAPRSWLWQGAFACTFTLAILTKELSIFIGPPLAAAALMERFVRYRQLPLGRFALALAAPAVVSGVIFLIAAGGIGPFSAMAKQVLASPATNEFAVRYCAGPWYRYLIDYLCLSPAPTLLALFGVGALVQRVSAGEWSTPEVLFTMLGAGLLLEQAPFIKNVRYMVALELPLRFLAVSFCFRLARRRSFESSALVAAAALVAMCFWDWQSYRRIFVDAGGYDPLSVNLLQAREIVPR